MTVQHLTTSEARTPLWCALAYINRGWKVLPLAPGSKQPLSALVPNGFHGATSDPETARRWWTAKPDAGIGLAMKDSGLVCVDVDARNGGLETLERLEAQHGPMQSDVMAYTPGGGMHFLFSAQLVGNLPGTLGAGIDLKADGYIAVEPSQHPNGKAYAWEASSDPLEGCVPSSLPGWIRDLVRAPLQAPAMPAATVPPMPAERRASLQQALGHIPADDRDTWLQVGMAIQNELPTAEGFDLWTQWSQHSPKFNPRDQLRVWRSFEPKGLAGVGVNTVFKMAQLAGWKNRGPAPDVGAIQGSGQFKLRPSDVDFTSLEPVDWVIDGFIGASQVVVFAGQPGVGKSTVFSSLALVVAGFAAELDSDIKVTNRRRVVIVSEHAQQYARLFYGMCRTRGIPPDRLAQWVAIFDASRLKVAEVAAEVKNLIDVAGGDEPPLVILDTANALFELADENSNAEVGAMISAIKGPVIAGGAALWIIAHAAKALGREDDEISPRGASAYIGDVHATGSVFRDKNFPDSTFVRSLKNRDEREFCEIEVRTFVEEFTTRPDRRGVIQQMRVRLGVPMRADWGLRAQAAQDAQATQHALVGEAKRKGAGGRPNQEIERARALANLAYDGMRFEDLRSAYFEQAEGTVDAKRKAFVRAWVGARDKLMELKDGRIIMINSQNSI